MGDRKVILPVGVPEPQTLGAVVNDLDRRLRSGRMEDYRPIATGFTAWKIAKGLYIVPLLIAYTPLLGGGSLEVLEVFVFGVFGMYALNGAIDGYLESPVGWVGRFLLAVAALALLWPSQTLWHSAGLAVFALVFGLSVRGRRRIEAHGETRS